MLRRVVLDGESLATAWTDGGLAPLALHSLLLLAGGALVFAWCERVARRQGTLGQY